MFRNQGVGTGKIRETVLVRSPRGTQLSHRIDLEQNPDRVIYRIEVNGDCTYLGTFTHASAARGGAFVQAREKN